jgi:hypothetical protein
VRDVRSSSPETGPFTANGARSLSIIRSASCRRHNAAEPRCKSPVQGPKWLLRDRLPRASLESDDVQPRWPAPFLLLACSWPALALLPRSAETVPTYWNSGSFGQDRPSITCICEFLLFLQACRLFGPGGWGRQVRIGLRPQPATMVSRLSFPVLGGVSTFPRVITSSAVANSVSGIVGHQSQAGPWQFFSGRRACAWPAWVLAHT